MAGNDGKWAVRTPDMAKQAVLDYIKSKQERAKNSMGLVSLMIKDEETDLNEVARKVSVSSLINDKAYGFVFPVRVVFGEKRQPVVRRYLVKCQDGKVYSE
ncbi:hypothetical protein C4561_00125 [candidate division WWE3 bacterium]|jgi:hypothetical protein|uniref:Uncharacterized protein n=1 Tax=candidate division WWE3 bacterium TaxID=2053526 RepID=A0A3A4ZGI5_UNCKA|nr:MAG: hypothetical protein C4561_00125 [candidate division WWE3 bacterium]